MNGALLPLLLALVAPSVREDVQPKIAELEQFVAEHPNDLDAELKLALLHSWGGDRRTARRLAEDILKKSPKYKDAQLLLARLDAWERNYAASRARLNDILHGKPNDRDTRLQLLDVELWSGDDDAARELAAALIKEQPSADLYYHLAQVDLDRLHFLEAYLDAGEALSLDPTHEKAKALRSDIPLVLAETDLQLERLPGSQTGHAEILTVTGLPRNHLSLTATEEFRRRFGTNNNRVALQFDWRQSKDFTLTLLGALGAPATVIPEKTASVRGALQLYGPLDAALGYTFDALPNAATLSRVRFDTGVRATRHLRGEASYTFGYYTQNGQSDTTHAFQLRACWEGESRACAFYGYGAEIYGPVTLDPSVSLARLTSHDFGADAILRILAWLDLRLEADVELRLNATRIYRGTLGGRFWF